MVTTDYRGVLGEAVLRNLGTTHLDAVFPGANLRRSGFLNFMT